MKIELYRKKFEKYSLKKKSIVDHSHIKALHQFQFFRTTIDDVLLKVIFFSLPL